MQQGLPLRFGILAKALFETRNRRLGDQYAAMQANEALRELFFKMRERFVEQILPAGSSRRNVLKIGLEINDVGHRDQQQAPALVT